MRFMFHVLYDAAMNFVQDDGWAISSHIALSILTSMFPFLIFVTALAGFLGSADLSQEAVQILFQTWPEQVAKPLASEVHNVLTQTRGGLVTLGGVLSIYFSSSGVEALRIALNRAYGVAETRPWYVLRLESIGYVMIGAVALLTLTLSVVFAPLIWTIALHFAPHLEPLDRLVTFSRFGIATLVLLLALVIVHKFLPAGRRTLWQIFPGIVFTFALWVAGGAIFGSYLAEFARNYVTTYAGLASVMIALVFLYMISSIFIAGGELNAALLRARAAAEKEKKSGAVSAP
ncbi:ribonuclease BN [Methylocella silvestris BL2]|uniref:Ribonuclease BN n=1 Tax=Methylocella silvestris (strain DSM 15510 / CIP 108128 / LMG 27833 / NCIMB 13906 / BL2) TaxID=395965 RepID=B8EP21_METSB|nr:YihY/virulence factor BrkB family protein [Methylocella silvestris]ACK49259.1 ribonuclease BN [Methylocella silvestris BL2]